MKKILSVLLATVMLLALIPLGAISVSAYAPSRDDGTWLFPLPKTYYNNFSDWAGCPGNDKCIFCGTYHSGWGDSAHTGQGGHNGFDVAAPAGTNVYASAGGKAYTFYNSARGNTVVIEHTIGNGYSYYTYYQHLSSASVSNGVSVSVGQVIGKVGNTGDSGGNHLHFGMVMGTSGQTGSSSLLNSLEGKGWITTSGYKSGRILNNPASTNDAGFPTGKSAVVPPLKAHYGSTHYTFDANKVTVGNNQTPITYSAIATGTYLLKNNGRQEYANVEYGTDVNNQNIRTGAFGDWGSVKYEIKPSTVGYSMRPLCSSSRMVNVYGNTVTSGNNVCIWDDTGHDSQRWNFEKVSGGYVIRNVQNPSCVLDAKSDGDVYVSTYTGASNQIWSIQNTVAYDANGGAGAPVRQFKDYDVALTLSSAIPTRDGYVFEGWATTATATTAQYAAGSAYTVNETMTLYAVWETVCTHIYDNDCDASCNNCGTVRDVAGHNYTVSVTTAATCGTNGVKTYTCSDCGDSYTESIPATGDHVYDNDNDPSCNTCGAIREVAEIPADAPAFVVEDVTARYGNTFTVAIRTQNNPGITGLRLKVYYDNELLELVSAEEGAFAGVTYGPLVANPFTFTWFDALHPDNTTSDAVVLLTFRAKEGTDPVQTVISLTYDTEDVYNAQWESVWFNTISGTISLTSIALGDANNDGNVNVRDLGIMQQYLNGWDVTIIDAACDVNADGKFNVRDLGLLQQYLNGWDVELK